MFSWLQFDISEYFLDSWLLKSESIYCPETSVRDYHYKLRNSPEDCTYHYINIYTKRLI